MSRALSVTGRVRVSSVPRFPGGCSFVRAFKRGYMPETQINSFNWASKIRSRPDSKSWQRVSRNSLMPTVKTAPRPEDGAGGNCLHWDDHRLLTIMEARRAQAFPDDEVLIGSPSDQWKIVGNGVARLVALALGVSLRTAWLANAARQETPVVPVDASPEDSVKSIEEDCKIEEPTLTACGEAARGGWSAQNVMTKLTTALTSSRSLASAISDTIG